MAYCAHISGDTVFLAIASPKQHICPNAQLPMLAVMTLPPARISDQLDGNKGNFSFAEATIAKKQV